MVMDHLQFANLHGDRLLFEVTLQRLSLPEMPLTVLDLTAPPQEHRALLQL